MTYVTQKDRMPTEEHWAIITYSSVFIPGDERSRTHPGHGYPERYESVVTYKAYMDEDEWKNDISRMECNGDTYTAMKAIPATVSTNVTVDVS